MKATVIYNSRTGFTKKYAEWIAGELNCEARPYKDYSDAAAGADDCVIFGSYVLAGKVRCLEKVKARFCNRPGQKLIVFATGAAPASAEKVIEKLWADNFSEPERESIPHFYMQGGLNYERMGFMDRALMKMVSRIMRGKKNKSGDEIEFERTIRGSFDGSSKEHIAPLLSFIQNEIGRRECSC